MLCWMYIELQLWLDSYFREKFVLYPMSQLQLYMSSWYAIKKGKRNFLLDNIVSLYSQYIVCINACAVTRFFSDSAQTSWRSFPKKYKSIQYTIEHISIAHDPILYMILHISIAHIPIAHIPMAYILKAHKPIPSVHDSIHPESTKCVST